MLIILTYNNANNINVNATNSGRSDIQKKLRMQSYMVRFRLLYPFDVYGLISKTTA